MTVDECPDCCPSLALIRALLGDLDAGDDDALQVTLERMGEVAAAPLPGLSAGPPQHDAATPGRRRGGRS